MKRLKSRDLREKFAKLCFLLYLDKFLKLNMGSKTAIESRGTKTQTKF
mgnify:CR=1